MAALFRFALQPLLDQRRHAEERQRQRCAAHRRDRDAALRDCERFVTSLAARVVRGIDAFSLASFDAAIASRKRCAAAADAELEAALRDLSVTRRDRRGIEMLRERRRREHAEEEARRDEQEVEESNARLRAR